MGIFNIVTRRLLPLVLFPAISYLASQIVYHNFFAPGVPSTLAICSAPVNSSLCRITYTGIDNVDYTLCHLVASFHGLMDPDFLPFIGDLMTAVAIMALVPFLEASRGDRPFALCFATVFALLSQIFSMAIVLPYYWLLFIFFGAATLHNSSAEGTSKINQGNAEALLFSLIVGYYIPSVCMFVMKDPIVTALWQAFPVWMLLAIFMHRLIRRPSRLPQSGYKTIRATYIIIFVLSAVTHIYFHWSIVQDIELLKSLYIPSIALLSPTTFELAIRDVIQWDYIFGVVPTMLVTLWFAENSMQIVVLLVWHLAASAAFGPGAAITGVYMWREAKLNAREVGLGERKIKIQ